MDLRSVDRWRYVERLMNELSAERNPMLGPILSAVELAQREHFAGMPGQEAMLFNPGLNQTQRNRRLAELAVWLRLLTGSVSANAPIERPDPQQILDGQLSAQSNHRMEER
ncbi:hypothetical protein D9M69_693070 [compost metagenome]